MAQPAAIGLASGHALRLHSWGCSCITHKLTGCYDCCLGEFVYKGVRVLLQGYHLSSYYSRRNLLFQVSL